MTTIIPIPAFGDNYGCGREYTPANLRFARAVEAADVLLQERQAFLTCCGETARGLGACRPHYGL